MDEREYYIQQHRLAHGDRREFRGRSLPPHVERINQLLREHQCHSILDYGCGKAECWPPEWQGRIQGYDPAYEPHSERPQGVYDMVICTDVLEHVPKSAVAAVIQDIFELRRRWAYISICTRPSHKTLPDGSNKHVTVQSPEWWHQLLEQYDRYTVVYT